MNQINRRKLLQAGLVASFPDVASNVGEASTRTSDLTSLTLESASQALRKRALSPVELTKACLDRIERLNPTLNAFAVVTAEQALAEARTHEKEIHAGKWRGPLHGIPIGVKDNIDVANVPTSEALRMLRDRIPQEDSEVVRRLRAAGAILLGKHNMHEIAFGYTSAVSCFGPVHNPWSRNFIAGGSSGGSAAAVAGGLCFGAVATDAGGSIRLPSAYSGVVGLKPTYGLVSIRGGGGWWSINHIGPIARTVADAALLLQYMAGYDEQESTSVRAPATDYVRALRARTGSLRMGVPRAVFFEDLPAGTERAVADAIAVLRRLTGEVREVRLPKLASAGTAYGEVAALHGPRFEKTPEVFHPAIRKNLERAIKFSAAEYIRNRREIDQLRRNSETLFPGVDLLVTPTSEIVPIPIEEALQKEPWGSGRNVSPFNKYGLPAISVPCGFSNEGLPIGLQIIGRQFREADVLTVAHAFERATEWHKRRPTI
jgi:aspartyl-tRNA(Asn)/glutamyl-tRNA(Gln) amidotransferase subunit A